MITYIDRVCISNAAPFIRRDLGLSVDQMGYVFSIFAVAYGWYFYITWLPTYLREGRGLTLGTSALLGGLPLFFGGIGNMAGVALTSLLLRLGLSLRWARKSVCCLGFVGASGFLILSTVMHNPLAAILAISMASFSNDLVMAAA